MCLRKNQNPPNAICSAYMTVQNVVSDLFLGLGKPDGNLNEDAKSTASGSAVGHGPLSEARREKDGGGEGYSWWGIDPASRTA
jgi:hypothetical protein